MTSRLWMLFVVAALVALGGPGVAQEPDARTILQAALKAMGGDNLKSIQYSGEHRLCLFGRPELFPGERLAGEPVDQLHPDH